jgi:hypothetical protein
MVRRNVIDVDTKGDDSFTYLPRCGSAEESIMRLESPTIADELTKTMERPGNPSLSR